VEIKTETFWKDKDQLEILRIRGEKERQEMANVTESELARIQF